MKKALFITLALLATILVVVGCSYNVDVSLTKIEVTSLPTEPQYVGCSLNTKGMVVTGYYNRSNFNTQITGYTTSPTTFTKSGTNKVEVTYEGKSTSFDIEVSDDTLNSLSVKKEPNKLLYRVGDKLDLEGLELEGKYLSGKTESITSGYSVNPTTDTSLTTSNTNVTFTYKDKSVEQKIYVVDESTKITFKGIEVTSKPINYQYVGESLDKTGLVVSGVYQVGSSELKSVLKEDKYETSYSSPITFTKAGKETIYVTYTDSSVSTTSFDVEVYDKVKVPTSIKVVSSNSDIYYNDFDNTKFKTSDLGVVIEVEYSNGTKTTKTDKDFTMFSSTISGGSVVTKEDNKVHTFTIYYTENGVTQKTSFDYKIVVYTKDDYVMITGTDLFNKVLNGTSKSSITYIKFCKDLPSGVTATPTNLDSGNIGLVKGYLTTDNKIYIVGDKFVGNENCSCMFMNFSDTKKIEGLECLDTTKVTNMMSMFYGCSGITTLGFSNFDTSKVTNMLNMFNKCSNLESLDLSNFDTSNVTDMSFMFSGCSSLTTSLDLSNFDTSSVTNMGNMFKECKNLKVLDLSNFDTSSVTNMNSMFSKCSSLETIKGLNNFNTSGVISIGAMFYGCSKLEILDLSSFNTSSVTVMENVFRDCRGLKTIYVSNKWSTSSVKEKDSVLFVNCLNLSGKDGEEEFKWSKQSGTQQTDVTYAKIYKAGTQDGYLTDVEEKYMLTSGTDMWTSWTDSEGKNPQNIKKPSITKIVFTDNENRKPDSYTLFRDLTRDKNGEVMGYLKGTEIYIIGDKIVGYPDCKCMFSDVDEESFFSSLTDLDLSNFDTSKVTDMSFTFAFCQSLTTLNVSNFDTSKVSNMRSIFSHCSELKSIIISSFNTTKVSTMSRMFEYCSNLKTLDLSSFKTSSVTEMDSMFKECTSLKTLDLSSFKTSSVTNMVGMFSGCSGLTTIYVSNKWNTSNVSNSGGMFSTCSNLSGKDGAEEFKWSDQSGTQKTDATYAKIYKYNGGGASTVEGYLTDISQKP